jgi:predicted metalloprotease
VSTQLRDILIAFVAAIAFVGFLYQQGRTSGPSEPEQPAKVEAFPASVVARAPALPDFADGAWTRVQQRVDSLNAMWEQAFADAGAEYVAPRLVQSAGQEGCGATQSGWAGLYCPHTKTLVVDLSSHVQRHQAAGQGFSELLLGYIVAHELGHHVQTLRGAPDRASFEDARRRELHAECLAGVWGRAAGQPLPPTWAYAADPVHGTVQEQIRWLNVGYRAARPADCDVILTGAPV